MRWRLWLVLPTMVPVRISARTQTALRFLWSFSVPPIECGNIEIDAFVWILSHYQKRLFYHVIWFWITFDVTLLITNNTQFLQANVGIEGPHSVTPQSILPQNNLVTWYYVAVNLRCSFYIQSPCLYWTQETLKPTWFSILRLLTYCATQQSLLSF